MLYVNKKKTKEKDERMLVLEFSFVFGDAYNYLFF